MRGPLARVCDMEDLRSIISWANLREMICAVRRSLYEAYRKADEGDKRGSTVAQTRGDVRKDDPGRESLIARNFWRTHATPTVVHHNGEDSHPGSLALARQCQTPRHPGQYAGLWRSCRRRLYCSQSNGHRHPGKADAHIPTRRERLEMKISKYWTSAHAAPPSRSQLAQVLAILWAKAAVQMD